MPKARLEFWFEFASTYSYLSAARLDSVADAAGFDVDWRPFLLGPIFADQGWRDSPFNLQPVKGRYMWRDMERLCEGFGIVFTRPSQFPRNGLLAARVATAAFHAREGWARDFVRSVYAANFAQDRDIGDRAVVESVLAEVGADVDAALALAESGENKARLKASTEEAREKGIFGAPSFIVDGELFWGNDRMGDAISRALLGS